MANKRTQKTILIATAIVALFVTIMAFAMLQIQAWGISVERNLLWQYFVYMAIITFACMTYVLFTRYVKSPKFVEAKNEDKNTTNENANCVK